MVPNKILLHFNILLPQNVTQFSQNPFVQQKRQNDFYRDNINMHLSPKSGNYAIGCTPTFSESISHNCEKAIKKSKPLRGVP